MYLRLPGFPLTVLPNYGVGLFLPAAVIQQCFYIRNKNNQAVQSAGIGVML